MKYKYEYNCYEPYQYEDLQDHLEQMAVRGWILERMDYHFLVYRRGGTQLTRYALAYHPEVGEAIVRCEAGGDPFQVVVGFADRGRPYNPLAREDPDVTLDAEQRQIGGLGIFMTKKLMDDIQYEFQDGQNILTLRKKG